MMEVTLKTRITIIICLAIVAERRRELQTGSFSILDLVEFKTANEVAALDCQAWRPSGK